MRASRLILPLLTLLAVVAARAGAPWFQRTTGDGLDQLRAVATNGTEFVAVGDDGLVMVSDGGRQWRTEQAANASLKDIVWGDDEFVAVGSTGYVVRFSRSRFQSGARSQELSGAGSALNGVAFSGSRFVAVGDNGKIRRTYGSSPSAWPSGTSGTTKHLYGVAWTGSYWIAVGQDGTILRSGSTGSSWTAMESNTTDDLRAIAANASGVVAVGERGLVMTSTKTGHTWTQRRYSTGSDWQDVAWDGSRWLAAAAGGRVYSSTDGISWTAEPRGVGGNLSGLAVGDDAVVAVGDDTVVRASSGGSDWSRVAGRPTISSEILFVTGRFMASTGGGLIGFSPDGIEWEEHDVGGFSATYGLVRTGERFLAAGPSHLYASDDGLAWSEVTPYSSQGQYRDLAWNGSLAVAVGANGLVRTSEDGLAWTDRDTGPAEEDFFKVIWTGTRWLAVGHFRIFSSDDGLTWAERAYWAGGFFKDIAWTGEEAVAVGINGILLRSPDGVTWTDGVVDTGTVPPLGAVYTVGDTIYAYGFQTHRVMLESGDGGVTWTDSPYLAVHDLLGHDPDAAPVIRLGAQYWQFVNDEARSFGEFSWYRDLQSVHWDGERAIAVGSQGAIRSSRDGREWIWHQGPTSDYLRGITKSDTTWVAVGSGGAVLHSPDGTRWLAGTSGTTEWLNGVCWAGVQFVAVGRGGTIVTSPDGATWTGRTSPVDVELWEVAWNGTRLAAVGATGVVLSSEDGATWTERTTPDTTTRRGIVWTGTHFVTDGAVSVDGITWEPNEADLPVPYGLAWNGSEAVMVGSGAARSEDGATWSTDATGTLMTLFSVAWTGDQFVAVGRNGLIMTSGVMSNWQIAEGIPLRMTGDADDPNNDGVPNLVAFATGLPGMAALSAEERGALPHLEWNPLPGRWEVVFDRLWQIPDGLSYHVEESVDGGTWTALGAKSALTPWPESLNVREEGVLGPTWEVGFPVTFDAGAKWWRVRVERR